MKASIKTILSLLFASTLFTACDECGEATVTPITESDAEWLVYENQDTIRYISNANDTVKFILTNAFVENVPAEGYSISDDCIEKLDTQAGRVIQDVKQKWPGMATYILKKPDDLTVSLVLQGNKGITIDEENPTYATKDINGLNYQDVFEIKNDSTSTTKAGELKHLYFNKENGFIEVEYFGGRSLRLQ